MLKSLVVSLNEFFFPLTMAITILGSIFILSARLTVTPRVKGHAVFLLAFGFLGGVIGLIAGVSREPIVGGMVTGTLGIVSALLSYMFGKESLKEWQNYIPYAIMLLIVSSLAGLSIGGSYKNEREQFDRTYKEYLLEYEKVYLEVLKEERLVKLRAVNADAQNSRTSLPVVPKQ